MSRTRHSIQQANELIELGHTAPALEILFQVIANARHKNIFNPQTQEVMLRFVKYAVRFQQANLLKNALRHYFNISLKTPSSLLHVCTYLMDQCKSHYFNAIDQLHKRIDSEREQKIVTTFDSCDPNTLSAEEIKERNIRVQNSLFRSFLSGYQFDPEKSIFEFSLVEPWTRFIQRIFKILLDINSAPTHISNYQAIVRNVLSFFASEGLSSQYYQFCKDLRRQKGWSPNLENSLIQAANDDSEGQFMALTTNTFPFHLNIHFQIVSDCLKAGWLQEAFHGVVDIYSLFNYASSHRIRVSPATFQRYYLSLSSILEETSAQSLDRFQNSVLDHFTSGFSLFKYMMIEADSYFRSPTPPTEEQTAKFSKLVTRVYLLAQTSLPLSQIPQVPSPTIHPISLFTNSTRLEPLSRLCFSDSDQFNRQFILNTITSKRLLRFVNPDLFHLEKRDQQTPFTLYSSLESVFTFVKSQFPKVEKPLEASIVRQVLTGVASSFSFIDISTLSRFLPFMNSTTIHQWILHFASIGLFPVRQISKDSYLFGIEFDHIPSDASSSTRAMLEHLKSSPFEYSQPLSQSSSRFASSIYQSCAQASMIDTLDLDQSFFTSIVQESEAYKAKGNSVASYVAEHRRIESEIKRVKPLALKEELDETDYKLAVARKVELKRQQEATQAAALQAEKNRQVIEAISFVKAKAALGIESTDEVVEALKNIKSNDISSIQAKVLEIKTEIEARSLLKRRKELQKYRQGLSYRERARREKEAPFLDKALQSHYEKQKSSYEERLKMFSKAEKFQHDGYVAVKHKLSQLSPHTGNFEVTMEDHEVQLWEESKQVRINAFIRTLTDTIHRRIARREKFLYAYNVRREQERARMERIQQNHLNSQPTAASLDWGRKLVQSVSQTQPNGGVGGQPTDFNFRSSSKFQQSPATRTQIPQAPQTNFNFREAAGSKKQSSTTLPTKTHNPKRHSVPDSDFNFRSSSERPVQKSIPSHSSGPSPSLSRTGFGSRTSVASHPRSTSNVERKPASEPSTDFSFRRGSARQQVQNQKPKPFRPRKSESKPSDFSAWRRRN